MIDQYLNDEETAKLIVSYIGEIVFRTWVIPLTDNLLQYKLNLNGIIERLDGSQSEQDLDDIEYYKAEIECVELLIRVREHIRRDNPNSEALIENTMNGALN